MSEQSNNGADFDLSPFVQRVSITLDDYRFTLPLDMPTPLVVAMTRALTTLGNAMEDEGITAERISEADGEMWRVVGEIMQKAEPAPPRPARELLTTSAAVQLLNFLARRFSNVRETTISTPSSPSPTSTTAPSPSGTSSEAAPS
jgi:hypothetical protein